ncbi:methyltransferase domain-containing protein [Natronolimnobius sp. AArcel1]|uniref:methyltransferase domain-containing protein n=1 Tax=Natronolimnobius sp. AArcel1 TaxID=1679093 RepID=UPI0013EA1AD1|nr:methyltransferase domain-containing protein [Natronolimnobius sp. AArcel1]NGM70321.1 methyltransferase domain-containing protein [Natronolimnobius sp. AArcel1]
MTDQSDEPSHSSTDDVRPTPSQRRQLAAITEQQSIRDAVQAVSTDEEHLASLRSELFDVRRDDWRLLVSAHLRGRCLEVNAGYGRRSAVLADLVDDVYAVDPDRSKLRVLAAREDIDDEASITPIHASVETLPVARSQFDTIVADLTGCSYRTVTAHLHSLEQFLTTNGSLVVLADGITRHLGLPERLGLEQTQRDSQRPSVGRATAAGYRSVLQSCGFDAVNVLALFPTAQNVRFVLDATATDTARSLVSMLGAESGDNLRATLGTHAGAHLAQTGLLEPLYPSYCLVASRGPTPSPSSALSFSSPLLVSGRTRSVVLEYDDDTICGVSKIPNKSAHTPIIRRETRLLESLRETETGSPIAETLPEGHLTETRVGPVRTERPLDGTALSATLECTPEAFRRVLSTGVEWVRDFQVAFGDEHRLVRPAELERALTIPSLDLSPPAWAISHPIQTFSTPVHGDLHPENIYVQNGLDGTEGITVTDWEYGTPEGSPLVDAGLFPIHVGTACFGSVEAAVETLFCRDTEYARITADVMQEYGDAVGLSLETIYRLLPLGYIHRIALDWATRSITCYTGKLEERLERIERLWDLLDETRILVESR